MSETEKHILAIVIQENSLAHLLITNADKELFADHKNQLIFEEIKILHNKREPIQYPILADRLRLRVPASYLCSLGGFLFHRRLKDLKNDLIVALNSIKKERVRKEILKELYQQVKEPNFDFEKIQKKINRVELLDIEMETGTIEDCFDEMDKDDMSNLSVKIGLPSLDRATGGFRFGELVTFMARTTVGKTFWVLNVLNYLSASSDVTTAFFSLEMPKISILERLCQIRFSVNYEQAKEKLTADDQAKYLMKQEYKNLLIYSHAYSVGEIEMKIQESGAKIVFIDYLDLLTNHQAKYQSRYERISDLILDLKRLARRQDILIIILHQLQRQAGSGGVPVRLTMARDSGVIEEVSDFVLGAWRPELEYDNTASIPEDMKGRIFIKLLKNKRGPIKIIPCIFDNNSTGKIWEIKWEK